MLELTKRTQNNIEALIGKPFDEICDMGSDKGNDTRVVFTREEPYSVIRGNPYLAEGRFTTIEESDRYILRLIKESRRGRKTNK